MRLKETFMGKIVPPAARGKELVLIEACMTDDWNRACRCVDCEQVKCDDCFLYRAGGNNTAEDLKRFAVEYVKNHPSVKPEESKDDGMPEIKPGMAITFPNNKLGFMTSATRIMYVYPHNSYSAIIDGWDILGDQEDTDVPYSRIDAIYTTSDTDNETGELLEGFTPCRLARMAEAISNGEDLAKLDGVNLIWRRQDYKEMTVKDIEKALGYKIKIVGEGGDGDNNNKTI